MGVDKLVSQRGLAILRWAAGIVGTVFVVIVVVLNFAGGRPDFPPAMTAVDVLQGVGMVIAWAGIVVAWKWPLLGGGLTIGGYLFFEGMTFAKLGRMAGGLFLLFPILGLAHIVYWWQKRPRNRP